MLEQTHNKFRILMLNCKTLWQELNKYSKRLACISTICNSLLEHMYISNNVTLPYLRSDEEAS